MRLSEHEIIMDELHQLLTSHPNPSWKSPKNICIHYPAKNHLTDVHEEILMNIWIVEFFFSEVEATLPGFPSVQWDVRNTLRILQYMSSKTTSLMEQSGVEGNIGNQGLKAIAIELLVHPNVVSFSVRSVQSVNTQKEPHEFLSRALGIS